MKKHLFPIRIIDLHPSIYIELEPAFKSKFFKIAISTFGSKSLLCKAIGVPRTNIDGWINRDSCPLATIQLIYLRKPVMNKHVPISEIEKNIIKLRGKTNPFGISRPKFPFSLTPELSSVIGHFLGDGGIKERDLTPIYCNIYPDAVSEVYINLEKVFGGVDYRLKKVNLINGTLTYLTFPTVLGMILTETFSLNPGKKSKNEELRIPEFILDAKDERVKIAFLRAIYDDEGSISIRRKGIRIEMANRLLVGDIRELLLDLGIPCGKLYQQVHRNSVEWYVDISSQKDLLLFRELIGSNIAEKQNQLSELSNSYRTPIVHVRMTGGLRNRLFSGLSNRDIGVSYISFSQWKRGIHGVPVNVLINILRLKGEKIDREEMKFHSRNSVKSYGHDSKTFIRLEKLVGLSRYVN